MASPANELRDQQHKRCFVCDPSRAGGMKVSFVLNDAGVAIGRFDCNADYEGYDGLVHGGVIATLLDAIMTNCLFQHGHVAVTADLRVRYRKPVLLHQQAELRGWIAATTLPLFRMKAELHQDGIVKATAQATFFDRGEP